MGSRIYAFRTIRKVICLILNWTLFSLLNLLYLGGGWTFYNAREASKFPAFEIPNCVDSSDMGNLKLTPGKKSVTFLKTLTD